MAQKLSEFSEKELKNRRINKQVDKFMGSVRAFLSSKNGGSVAPEWECSLLLLETYYKQFLQLSEEIDSLDSLIVASRYGAIPSPLLGARDKCAIRIESLMKSVGITFKESLKLDLVEPVVEESPLEQWITNKNKGREER